jgi:outer membrane protein assembly factor BamB
MPARCRPFVLLVLVLLAIRVPGFPGLSRAVADDWPQFRGPDGQGHADASAIPAALDSEQSLRAVCLDRESGQVVHDVEVFRKEDLGRINNKNSHASPTPVIDGQRVYVHFGSSGTACLSTEGQVIWRRELKYDQHHGPGGSPVVWNDLVIVSCDGHDVQYTIALDKQTGEVRWRADHPGMNAYSTPIVIDVNGASQLITSGGTALIAYAPRDGKELWRCRHAGHSVVPRPVTGNGLVYFCTGYWNPALFAVRPTGQGDVTDSEVVFTLRRAAPHNPSPLVVGNRLYMVSDLGVLTCADATSGKEIWRERLSGNFSASPTLADGRIFLLDEDATTFVVAPGDKFKLLSENHLDGRALASPAFVNHAIYLRTDTHLYRIELPRNIQAKATNSRRDTGTFLR